MQKEKAQTSKTARKMIHAEHPLIFYIERLCKHFFVLC